MTAIGGKDTSNLPNNFGIIENGSITAEKKDDRWVVTATVPYLDQKKACITVHFPLKMGDKEISQQEVTDAFLKQQNLILKTTTIAKKLGVGQGDITGMQITDVGQPDAKLTLTRANKSEVTEKISRVYEAVIRNSNILKKASTQVKGILKEDLEPFVKDLKEGREVKDKEEVAKKQEDSILSKIDNELIQDAIRILKDPPENLTPKEAFELYQRVFSINENHELNKAFNLFIKKRFETEKVPPDGHCLYSAIIRSGNVKKTVFELRSRIASEVTTNANFKLNDLCYDRNFQSFKEKFCKGMSDSEAYQKGVRGLDKNEIDKWKQDNINRIRSKIQINYKELPSESIEALVNGQIETELKNTFFWGTDTEIHQAAEELKRPIIVSRNEGAYVFIPDSLDNDKFPEPIFIVHNGQGGGGAHFDALVPKTTEPPKK